MSNNNSNNVAVVKWRARCKRKGTKDKIIAKSRKKKQQIIKNKIQTKPFQAKSSKTKAALNLDELCK